MALADSGKAIGMVTKLLTEHLNNKTGMTIDVGRPEPTSSGSSGPKLNLFLFEAVFDPSLRNTSLDDGQQPPLWLILKYLMTGYDSSGETDTIDAQANVGEGMRSLQELNFLQLNGSMPSDVVLALQNNPEPLKITFDNTPSELLSNLMQGTDAKYRFSVGFQVRPVMIALGEPPSYSLLVGIDYTTNKTIGEDGIDINVLPSLGPQLINVSPIKFEVNETIIIYGSSITSKGLSARIGPVDISITAKHTDHLECLVNGTITNGEVISAGSVPISVVETLPTGRLRYSNLLVGNLLPTLATATPDSITRVTPADPDSAVFGNIDMTGTLLGTDEDDIFVALYRDGQITAMFDTFVEIPPPPVTPQTQMRLEISSDNAVPRGVYRVILRVNGQQAKSSPEIDLVAL